MAPILIVSPLTPVDWLPRPPPPDVNGPEPPPVAPVAWALPVKLPPPLICTVVWEAAPVAAMIATLVEAISDSTSAMTKTESRFARMAYPFYLQQVLRRQPMPEVDEHRHLIDHQEHEQYEPPAAGGEVCPYRRHHRDDAHDLLARDHLLEADGALPPRRARVEGRAADRADDSAGHGGRRDGSRLRGPGRSRRWQGGGCGCGCGWIAALRGGWRHRDSSSTSGCSAFATCSALLAVAATAAVEKPCTTKSSVRSSPVESEPGSEKRPLPEWPGVDDEAGAPKKLSKKPPPPSGQPPTSVANDPPPIA